MDLKDDKLTGQIVMAIAMLCKIKPRALIRLLA